MADKRKKTVGIRLPDELIRNLTKLAKRNGISLSSMICLTLIEAYPLKDEVEV